MEALDPFSTPGLRAPTRLSVQHILSVIRIGVGGNEGRGNGPPAGSEASQEQGSHSMMPWKTGSKPVCC